MGFIIKHDSAICTPENSYSNMRVHCTIYRYTFWRDFWAPDPLLRCWFFIKKYMFLKMPRAWLHFFIPNYLTVVWRAVSGHLSYFFLWFRPSYCNFLRTPNYMYSISLHNKDIFSLPFRKNWPRSLVFA